MTTRTDPGPIICEFCMPASSPVDGRVLRACQHCSAHTDPDAYCECTYCPWLSEDDE